MLKIRRVALESLLEGSRNVFPNEFLALLRGEKNGEDFVITEILLAPLSEYLPGSAYFNDLMVPTDPTIVGTFHSHPSRGPPRPSPADLHLFGRRGAVHLISSLPYSEETTAAFDFNGRKIVYEII